MLSIVDRLLLLLNLHWFSVCWCLFSINLLLLWNLNFNLNLRSRLILFLLFLFHDSSVWRFIMNLNWGATLCFCVNNCSSILCYFCLFFSLLSLFFGNFVLFLLKCSHTLFCLSSLFKGLLLRNINSNRLWNFSGRLLNCYSFRFKLDQLID